MNVISRQEALSLGFRKYFTGKICKNGHLSERRVYNSACIQCCKIATKQWHLREPEYARAQDRKFKLRNREKLNRISKLRYAENKDKYCAISRYRYSQNIEIERAKSREWVSRNLEKVRTRAKISLSKRRARKTLAGGFHTEADREMTWLNQRGQCSYASFGFFWCERFLTRTNAHWDHKVPISKGGTDCAENGQYLCRSCNLRKYVLLEEEFLARHGIDNKFYCE